MTIDSGGLYRLAYAVKGREPLAPERRSEWLAILGQVPLAERVGDASGTTGPPVTSGPTDPAGAAGRAWSPEELAAAVRRSGWLCPAGVKAAVKGQLAGPQGPLTTWLLARCRARCRSQVPRSVAVQ